MGSFDDLKTQEIKQLGGIPVQQLEKSFGKTFDGTITGFVDRASKGQVPKLADPVSLSIFMLPAFTISDARLLEKRIQSPSA